MGDGTYLVRSKLIIATAGIAVGSSRVSVVDAGRGMRMLATSVTRTGRVGSDQVVDW